MNNGGESLAPALQLQPSVLPDGPFPPPSD